MVGIPSFRNFPDSLRYHYPPYFDRPESPDFSESRIWPRKATTPTQVSILAAVALSIPAVRAPLLGSAFPRVHQERRVVDEVEQVTEPAGMIFSRPAVQLGLHPPYHDT